ncbi:MAG: hypothetical protein NVS9B4_00750 [Candidatus Acidiferrum sp.]
MVEVTIAKVEGNESSRPWWAGNSKPAEIFNVRFWDNSKLRMILVPCETEEAAIEAAHEVLNGRTNFSVPPEPVVE